MQKLTCRTVVAGLAVVALASAAHAQWTRNPSANTPVSVGGSDQNQAKVLPTADGGCYIVWLDGISTGWDTRLQRLDARGIKQLGPNGVLVADTAFSSTQDYGFAIDGAGNALIAYRDDGNVSGGPVHIKVQKVDPAGNLLWGSGVQVSNTAGGNAPHVCATSDGGAAVGWTESSVRIQKVDANGAVLWPAGGVSDSLASGTPSLADVQPGDNGSVIALYIKGSVPRHLFARKFDATGAKAWNSATTPVAVFDEAGNGVQFGATIYFESDGSGGAIFNWYGTGGTRNAYVQHINANGVEVFPHNGVTIADDIPGRIRISASASRDPATGAIYLASVESNAAPQGNYSIRAQRFNVSGVRQWGATGVEIIPAGLDQPSFLRVESLAGSKGDGSSGGAMFAWFNGGFGAQKVFATRLDGAGGFAWTPSILEPCTVVGGKARLWSSLNAGRNRLFLTWGDDRDDANDIYAQNVNLDGSLGLPGEVNGSGFVDVDDLIAVILGWGACDPPPTFCDADVAPPPAGNGQVDVDDLIAVILSWG